MRHAAGYTVHVATKARPAGHHLCCGRSLPASGMIDEAKRKAAEMMASPQPFAESGIPILGLEPSCRLTLRDETRVMGLGQAAHTISAQAMLLEELLARSAAAGQLAALSARLQPCARPILLYRDCHQKAFGAVSPILHVLRLIPGAQPWLIESGCCGMAGSFGYDATHHAVSMQMAELSPLSAVRAQADAIVVADGARCRHQIKDGAGRQAVHVAVLLAQQLRAAK